MKPKPHVSSPYECFVGHSLMSAIEDYGHQTEPYRFWTLFLSNHRSRYTHHVAPIDSIDTIWRIKRFWTPSTKLGPICKALGFSALEGFLPPGAPGSLAGFWWLKDQQVFVCCSGYSALVTLAHLTRACRDLFVLHDTKGSKIVSFFILSI